MSLVLLQNRGGLSNERKNLWLQRQPQPLYCLHRPAVSESLRHGELLLPGPDHGGHPRVQPHRGPVHGLQVLPETLKRPADCRRYRQKPTDAVPWGGVGFHSLCAEEAVVHVVFIAVGPVDAPLEAVFGEDLVDLAVDRDGVGVAVRAEVAAAQGLAAGVAVVVLPGVEVQSQAHAVLGVGGPAEAAQGVDGRLLGQGVDLVEDGLDRGGDILVDRQGPGSGVLVAAAVEVPGPDRDGGHVLLGLGRGAVDRAVVGDVRGAEDHLQLLALAHAGAGQVRVRRTRTVVPGTAGAAGALMVGVAGAARVGIGDLQHGHQVGADVGLPAVVADLVPALVEADDETGLVLGGPGDDGVVRAGAAAEVGGVVEAGVADLDILDLVQLQVVLVHVTGLQVEYHLIPVPLRPDDNDHIVPEGRAQDGAGGGGSLAQPQRARRHRADGGFQFRRLRLRGKSAQQGEGQHRDKQQGKQTFHI